MILENTPYTKVIETMLSEQEKVLFFVRKEADKVLKTAKREGTPLLAYSTYTIPKSNNTYLFWGGKIVTEKFFQNIGRNNFMCGSCLLVNASNGERMIYTLGEKNEGGVLVRTLMVYTSHFLRRYRERAKIPETVPTNELLATFMCRNTEMIPLDYSQVVKKGIKNGAATQMVDGIILGSETRYSEAGGDFIVFKFKTFLSDSMLKANQHDALMTKRKYYGIVKEYVKRHSPLPRQS